MVSELLLYFVLGLAVGLLQASGWPGSRLLVSRRKALAMGWTILTADDLNQDAAKMIDAMYGKPHA
jgi:hypothetical protein